MKIYIDINHPAHVHYFRNFIKIMESKGHNFIITNRNSPIINQLLDHYKIPHHIRNKRPKKPSLINSVFYLINMVRHCIYNSFIHRPDLYLGFGASQCAITSFFFCRPCVLLDDTEFNRLNHILYKPFCSTVLTPFYFRKKLNRKQIYFDAYIEQLYLHSDYYNYDSSTLDELGINSKTPYALIRYISYDATHDRKVQPILDEIKKDFLLNIKNKMAVFVSLESGISDSFYDEYKLKVSPDKIHDVMAGASFFLTEGITMASEACMLGVPYILINPLPKVGYIFEQEKKFSDIAMATTDIHKIKEYTQNKIADIITPERKKEIQNEIEKSTINPTKFLVWFVENYPQSSKTMKENPNYQYNFK